MATSTEATQRTRRERYNPQEIEQKWKQAWTEADLYHTDLYDDSKPKWYALTMYPYPSGNLHIGHWYAMTPSDTAARYRRMRGYNVLFPMGFDAFGLPAENAAIARNIHPFVWTMKNIENMREQMRSMGAMFDWEKEVITCLPEYYKWNQWFFLQFLKKGIAYRKEAAVWWCPKDQTVLANEQVIDGRCERCGTEVYQRQMAQWFYRITAYADELLSFNDIEWPEPVMIMQRTWIGRSEGASVSFKTESGDAIEVFTTRPDTLWGATFMVLAPEHPLVESLTTDAQREAVATYQDQTRRQSEIERQATDTDKEKTGVFTGGYAINPVNNERVPVWIADYVLMTYGTGAIMAVPAHDERDFDFALKFGLPIVPVVQRQDGLVRSVVPYDAVSERQSFQHALGTLGVNATESDGAFHVTLSDGQTDTYVTAVRAELKPGSWASYAGTRTGFIFADTAIELDSTASDREIVERTRAGRTAMEILRGIPFYTAEPDVTFHHDVGAMINSGALNGTPGDTSISTTIEWLQKAGVGTGEVNYRLRDWLISRQRYWGTPIPIIYCDTCGAVPVPEEDLPVLLPEDSQFSPTGESPLKSDPRFLNVTCPTCGGPATRETDTMDCFVDSAWYQFRYLSPHYDAGPVDPDLTPRWTPVDQYTGGIEHATKHLLYARFFTKAMRDLGLIDFGEPFLRLFNQGIILGEDSEKMSKSRGNVIDPDALVDELGADTVRLFLMFLGPWNLGGPWNSRGIVGPQRFLERAFTVVTDTAHNATEERDDDATRQLRRVTHQTIRDVTRDVESFSFNTMVAHLMEFVNELMRQKDDAVAETAAWREALETLALLMAPAAPYMAEELWSRLDKPFSVHTQEWPTWSEELAAEDTIEVAVQVNGKVRGHIELPADAGEAEALSAAKANDRIRDYLDGKTIVKEIYVPGRLVNFVVR
jgi:leucyl-tRNA synthetase